MAGLYVKFSPRLVRDLVIAGELFVRRFFDRPERADTPDELPETGVGIHK
jgi:hypothetical protein